jgi:hypothetical protein
MMGRQQSRDLVASVRQRLMNLSRVRGEEFQFVLTRYGLERLLFRLTQSLHTGQIVLKGAALFQLWTGQPHHSTRDLDLLEQACCWDELENQIRAPRCAWRRWKAAPPSTPSPPVGATATSLRDSVPGSALPYSAWLRGRNCGHTQAQAVEPAVGRAVEANRRPAVRRGVVPAAAPDHPVRAGNGTHRIFQRRCPIIIRPVPVLTPFIHIPMHVVQTEIVRRKTPHRRCEHVTIFRGDAIPFREFDPCGPVRQIPDSRQRLRIIAPLILRHRSCPAGILPFGFGR